MTWTLLALGLLAAYAVWMLRAVTRPGATYVGTPPSKIVIWARRNRDAISRMHWAFSSLVAPAQQAAAAMAAFNEQLAKMNEVLREERL